MSIARSRNGLAVRTMDDEDEWAPALLDRTAITKHNDDDQSGNLVITAGMAQKFASLVCGLVLSSSYSSFYFRKEGQHGSSARCQC